MSEQDAAGGAPPESGVPREHPEDPAEGADEARGSEDPAVPRRHAQEPAEGASEPGDPS